MTNPRVFGAAIPMTDAWRTVEAWLSQPTVWVPGPTVRHRDVIGSLLATTPQSRHVSDTHLAALAIEHGLTLCSNDGDFARFAGLRWENPIG